MPRLNLLFFAFAVICAALASLPWKDAAAQRRLPWLLLLPLPGAAMLALGPIGFVRAPYSPTLRGLLMQAQTVGVGAAIVVALALLALVPGVRRASTVIGVLCVFATMAIAGANQIVIAPSS